MIMEVLKDIIEYGPAVVRELITNISSLGAFILFLLFISAALLAVFPAWLASSKGRDFFAWWLFGMAMFPVAFAAAFLIGPTKEHEERMAWRKGIIKKCPRCAEFVKSEAIVCRFCGHEFVGGTEFEKEL